MFEKEIIQHAESKPDEEVCGFILMNNDLTVYIEPTLNQHEHKKMFFNISF